MISMWGLKNCDTCRGARHWLEMHKISYLFHDVREETPDAARLARWLKVAGADRLINRRSTTWRTLPDTAKRQLEAGDVVSVLEQYPALIKRPIVEYDKSILIGFNAESYKKLAGNLQ